MDSEKDLDIFIFSHKDFKDYGYPENNCYKIVKMAKFDTDIPLEQIDCTEKEDDYMNKQHGYSEIAGLHYVYNNVELKKYVGTSHYRRYFSFYDNIPDFDKIFEDHDVIITNPVRFPYTIKEHYYAYHHKDDIDEVMSIIKEKYPEIYDKTNMIINNVKMLIPANMVIFKKEMFEKYCEFMFSIFDEFDRRRGFKTDNDIKKYVEENIDKFAIAKNADKNIDYQSRIEAFLSERITTIFIMSYCTKIPYVYNLYKNDKFKKRI